ncbi:MAG: ASCH domain-containing protein [Lachnospiraceae bacterium]|nr:ASCH domain-containing protein [Lachnospiraceae bacterium]
MEHVMKLKPNPFSRIKSGQKTIELRLYDEKRQLISVRDVIRFVNTKDETDVLVTEVKALHVFKSFDELYEYLPLLQCGYTEENVDRALPGDMEKYYSKEEQELYGVVGIEIALI